MTDVKRISDDRIVWETKEEAKRFSAVRVIILFHGIRPSVWSLHEATRCALQMKLETSRKFVQCLTAGLYLF